MASWRQPKLLCNSDFGLTILGRYKHINQLPQTATIGDAYMVDGKIYIYADLRCEDFIVNPAEPDDPDCPGGNCGNPQPPGPVLPTWFELVSTWTTEPVLVGVLPGGLVYSYVKGATTRYRFVPNIYQAAEDKFYSSFVNNNLTGLITARG